MPSPSGTTRTTSVQELAPEQRELLNLVMPNVRDYINQDLELYPDSTVAGFNPMQIEARENIASTATNTVDPLSRATINTAQNLTTGGAAAGAAGAGTLLGAGAQGAQSLADVLGEYNVNQGGRDFLRSGALLDPSTNPVLGAQSRAAIAPLEESLLENILPNIRSDFVGNNMFGSSRQGIAEGRAINDFLRQAGDITTNLQANNFEQGLGAMLSSLNSGEQAAVSGIGQGLGAGEAGTGQLFNAALESLAASPSLANLAFLPGMTLEGLGSSERQLEQSRLTEAANRFSTEQMLPFLQAQDVANLAFGIGGGSATTTANQGAAFDPLSTGLSFLMMAPMLMGLPF